VPAIELTEVEEATPFMPVDLIPSEVPLTEKFSMPPVPQLPVPKKRPSYREIEALPRPESGWICNTTGTAVSHVKFQRDRYGSYNMRVEGTHRSVPKDQIYPTELQALLELDMEHNKALLAAYKRLKALYDKKAKLVKLIADARKREAEVAETQKADE
jgi:hypothetical protein